MVNAAAGCPSLNTAINIISGGNLNLGPETATEFTGGAVFQPSSHFSASADWWSINRSNTIQVLPLQYLIQNYDLFSDRFIRDADGTLTDIDQTYGNAGSTKTEAIDFTVRGNIDILGGIVAGGLDGTLLLKKTETVTPGAVPINQVGVYSLDDDLGLKWKHNAYIAYSRNDFTVSLTQIFRDGYLNQVLPGVAAGTFVPPDVVTRVHNYITYNASISYSGFERLKLTFGVKNLLDKDPPFAISYDSNNGSGSSWEPRVADPRGRSFNLLAEVHF